MKNALTAVFIALALIATPLTASAQAINLGGSDSYEPIIRQGFITDTGRANGADISTFINWAGGGQGAGETPMKNNFNGVSGANQVISFFTAQLTDTGVAPANICLLNPGAQDIVLGVDGLLNVGNPARFSGGNPQLGNGTLTWQNVLSILYFGYDLTNTAAGNQCNSTVRRSLANDYASIFTGSGIPANTPIRHIYRRGDSTGTAKLFWLLLGIPSANSKFCNGNDFQDIDPIRRNALDTDQVAEFDGTLGLVLQISVPTFSNTVTNLYTGADGASPATAGKFLGGQGAACGSGPSSIDISTAGPGVAPTTYAGLAAPVPAELENLVRCDCRYPVPGNWPAGAARNSADAKRFNWNVKLGIGCQAPQAATAPSWGVLNGDDGTLENTPVAWGNRATAAVSAANVPYLSSGRARCCNVGSPVAFRREDPRLVNLFVRNPTNGNLQGLSAPSTTTPVLAFYRLAATNQGLSNVDKPFSPRCTQTLATDLLVSCLVTNVPGDLNSIGFGALTVSKDNAANGLPPNTVFNLNTDPVASNYASIRDRSYGLSRYVFLSSVRGFNAIGESAATHTGSLSTLAYDTAGTAAQKQIDAQWNLAKAIYFDSKRPDRANTAVEQFGFLSLNADTDPYAVACTGDANSPSATKIPLDNATYFAK